MKKWIAISAFVILSIGAIIPLTTNAKPGQIGQRLEKEFLMVAAERVPVEKGINKHFPSIKKDFEDNYNLWGLASAEDAPVGTRDGYKVYVVKPGFVTLFMNGSKFQDCIGDSYFWEVPLIDKKGKVVNTARFEFYEGEWQPVVVGLNLEPEDIDFSVNQTEIVNLLAAEGINQIDTIQHLRTGMPRLDLIYVDSEKGEYIIPLSTRPDLFTNVKMKSVYSAEEFVGLVSSKFDANEVKTDENGLIVVN